MTPLPINIRCQVVGPVPVSPGEGVIVADPFADIL